MLKPSSAKLIKLQLGVRDGGEKNDKSYSNYLAGQSQHFAVRHGAEKDSLGIEFPVPKAPSLISAIERMFTATAFTYRLVRLPYYLEVFLSQGLLADEQPSCTVCLRSSKQGAIADASMENLAMSDVFPDKQKEATGVPYFLAI